MIDKRLIRKAQKIALTSNVIRGKLGAILFKTNGHIITSASNVAFLGCNNKKTIHAEEFLIYKANRINAFRRYNIKNLNVLVVRTRKDGSLGNAKPCISCKKLLTKFKLNTYYTNDSGDICLENMTM